MSHRTLTKGLISASEMLVVARPNRYPSSLRTPIIFCPQAGGQATYYLDDAAADKGVRAQYMRRLPDDLGCVCAAADLGGANTFGNATSQARMLTLYNYLQTLPGVRLGRVLCVGTSMGALTALNFARANPGKVVGILSLFGLVDLTGTYVNNIAALQPAIAAAWGVAAPAPLPANADPSLNIAQLDGVKWRAFSGTADPLIAPATQQTFVDAMNARNPGSAQYTSTGATAHDDSTTAAARYEAIRDWLRSVAADV